MKKRLFAGCVLLFSSVLVVNIGYTFLSMSSCLDMALWANRVAYLGSVCLPFAMLMIILNVRISNFLTAALLALTVAYSSSPQAPDGWISTIKRCLLRSWTVCPRL